MNEVQQQIWFLRMKGWSITSIAEELGVARITVAQWVEGRRRPGTPKLVLLALAALLKRKRVPKRRKSPKSGEARPRRGSSSSGTKYSNVYFARGIAYASSGQYAKAIKNFDEAARHGSGRASLFNNRGYAYHMLGQYERAVEDFDKAINLEPRYFAAYKNRSWSYRNLGLAVEAAKDFQRYTDYARSQSAG